MNPGPPQSSAAEFDTLSDERVGRHWSHHQRFAARHPGRHWRFQRVRVPISQLKCLYADPGVSAANSAGLMGAVGLEPTGHAGAAIIDLAAAITRALAANRADQRNPALLKVLAMRDAGFEAISSAAEPFAVSRLGEDWFVREGTHRAIAFALIGRPSVDAVDFESAELL